VEQDARGRVLGAGCWERGAGSRGHGAGQRVVKSTPLPGEPVPAEGREAGVGLERYLLIHFNHLTRIL